MRRLVMVAALVAGAVSAFCAEYDISVLLDSRKAYLQEASKADALESDREFTRRWEAIPNRFLEDIAAEVRGRRTETDPYADQRKYSGTWRIAYVQILRGKEGDGQLFETLRYGLSTTLSDDEIRMGEHQGDPWAGGFRLKQVWPYIDPWYADTLITNLVSVTNVTSPQADLQTYSGLFVASEVGSRRLEDAAIEMWRWLTRVSSPTNAAGLSALPYRTIQKNEILRLFTWETGEGDMFGIVFDYLNPSDATRTALFAIADATLVSTFASGWTYSDRDWKVNKDNTATFTVIFKMVAWSNSSGSGTNIVLSTTNITGYSNYEPDTGTHGLTSRRTDGSDAVPSANAATIRENMRADSGFFLDRVVCKDNGDGSAGLWRDMTKARGTGDYFTVEWEAGYGNRPETETVTWFWLSNTVATAIYNDAKSNSAAMASAFWRAAPASHRLLSIRNDPEDNGARRVTRKTYIPVSGGSAWPETTDTYVQYQTNLYYMTQGTILYVRRVVNVEVSKMFPTYDSAKDEIVDWQDDAPYKDYYLQDSGTGVHSAGQDRYMATATFIVSWDGWTETRKKDAALGGGPNPWP